MRIKIPFHVGMCAFYKVEFVHSVTGKVRPCSDWTENVMLTSGMKEMSHRGDWFTTCQVGIDAVDPNAGDTDMPGWVAGTSTITVSSSSAQATAPFYGWKQKTFRFAVGSIVIATQINRVGVGWATAQGDNLVSLAKIVDVTGTPVAPNWQPDEYLDVTVEMRYYPPLVDAEGTVDFNAVTYGYLLRASDANLGGAWGDVIGSQIVGWAQNVSDWLAWDNDIGATVDSTPTGLTAASDTFAVYTTAPAGVQSITFGLSVGPTAWNLATDKLFRCLTFKTTAGWYQIQWDDTGISGTYTGNGIPKTTSFTMQVEFVMTWGQATIP